MKLIIPELPPSLNEYLRLHWTARRRLGETWDWLVRVAALEAGGARSTSPPAFARVTITLCYPTRQRVRDLDNATGGIKATLDSLRHNRLIVDDNPTAIELVVRQVVTPKLAQTVIEIEELERSAS